jgi:hypothetical protein
MPERRKGPWKEKGSNEKEGNREKDIKMIKQNELRKK